MVEYFESTPHKSGFCVMDTEDVSLRNMSRHPPLAPEMSTREKNTCRCGTCCRLGRSEEEMGGTTLVRTDLSGVREEV